MFRFPYRPHKRPQLLLAPQRLFGCASLRQRYAGCRVVRYPLHLHGIVEATANDRVDLANGRRRHAAGLAVLPGTVSQQRSIEALYMDWSQFVQRDAAELWEDAFLHQTFVLPVCE